MRFEQISLDIGMIQESGKPEVKLLFSRSVQDVRMTPNEAERHAYEMLDAVKVARKAETSKAGIDTEKSQP